MKNEDGGSTRQRTRQIHRMNKLFTAIGVALALTVGAWTGDARAKKLQVGFVYVGPTCHPCLTYSHDQGRAWLWKQFRQTLHLM